MFSIQAKDAEEHHATTHTDQRPCFIMDITNTVICFNYGCENVILGVHFGVFL